MKILDHFLSQPTGDLVKVFVMDGEGCNSYIRKAVFGELDRKQLDGLNWFSKLQFHELKAMADWPRYPIKAATMEGQYVYALGGVAHATKNAAGQMQSELRVIYCGDFFVDVAGTLQNNMPLPAFSRLDPMSDKLTALLNNPLFYVDQDIAEASIHRVNVPWQLKGALLMNLTCALCCVTWLQHGTKQTIKCKFPLVECL